MPSKTHLSNAIILEGLVILLAAAGIKNPDISVRCR